MSRQISLNPLDKSWNLLMIEDDPGDVRLVHELLSDQRPQGLIIMDADCLADGLEQLASHGFDAILLDLGLPDARSPDSIAKLVEVSPTAPVIVLTGSKDDDMVRQAFQAGAEDFLVKDSLGGDVLYRTIRNAMERRALSLALQEARAAVRREREWKGLERLAAPSLAARTAASYGEYPLSDASPDVWELLIEEYKDLLEASLTENVFKVSANPDRARAMAQRLGSLRAEPRDVVKIHMAAIKRAGAGSGAGRIVAITEEARVMLVEVMGYLALYYRSFMGPAPYQRSLDS